MRLGAAQAQRVDVLAGHRAHDVGAGDEDPALGAEDDDVGQRGAVRRAARGRAEHDRDLRHLAGRPGHDREDLADRVERDDALAQPGAAGVPEADDRAALGERAARRRQDHLAAGLAHRAALDGGVGAEGRRRGSVDATDRGEHPRVVLVGEQLDGARVEELPEPGQRVARVVGLVDHDLPAGGGGGRHCSTVRNATATLWPPKPKELFMASSSPSGSCRGSPRTTSSLTSSSRSSRFAVGGAMRSWMREDRGDGLDRAGRAEQVSGHRLGARHAHAVGRVAEGAADRLHLCNVADRRGRRVRVDVHDVGRGGPGGLERPGPWPARRRPRPGRAGRCGARRR